MLNRGSTTCVISILLLRKKMLKMTGHIDVYNKMGDKLPSKNRHILRSNPQNLSGKSYVSYKQFIAF